MVGFGFTVGTKGCLLPLYPYLLPSILTSFSEDREIIGRECGLGMRSEGVIDVCLVNCLLLT